MDNDVKLATFQDVSGITDLPLALQILETHNWDLERAIETALALGPDISAAVGPPPSPPPPPAPSLDRLVLTLQFLGDSYDLAFAPSQTVREVKGMMEALTGVSAQRQTLVAGSLGELHNNQTLRSLGLANGATVMMIENATNVPYARGVSPAHAMGLLHRGDNDDHHHHDSDDEPYLPSDQDEHAYEDEDEDEEDEYYYSDEDHDYVPMQPAPQGPPGLIAEDVDSALEGSTAFAAHYTDRYGRPHPDWFVGSFHDAVSEARRRARLLFVYIHSDRAIETNVFCLQTLANEQVLDILRANFVCWGWDATLPVNQLRLRDQTTGDAGRVLPAGPLMCPLTGIVLVTHDGTDVMARFGYDSAEGMVRQLLEAVETSRPLLGELREHNARVERERQARLAEQDEIDQAYRQSLEEDRRKAELKRREEEAERRRAQEEEEREQLAEARRRRAEDMVRPEPPADTKDKVCTIRFKFPEGNIETRRFLADTATINDLITLATARGYSDEDHVLMTTFPKRVLNDLPHTQTLAAANLSAREQIHVQER